MENGNQVNVNEVKVSRNKAKKQSFAKIANEKLGETVMQNCGEIAFIVEYIDSKNITIQFKTSGELVKTTYGNFVRGNVKSHFSPTVYGVGITGTEPTRDENGEQLDSYICWRDMLRRCYSAKFQEKCPTYKDCYVSEDWLYYPNFKMWYDKNYYQVENKTSQLDKDILIKNNKVYSPDTCVFVPQFINKLFVKCQNSRGKLPIGVCYDKKYKKYKKYKAQLRVFKNGRSVRKYLGSFDTPDEAFRVYKQAKEDYIKDVADNYKDKIPVELYEAMYDYKVEIDD